jgi:hypothetical protein
MRALPPALAGALLTSLVLAFAQAAAAQTTGGAACNPPEATLTLEPGQGCHQAPHNLNKGDAIVYAWNVTSPAGDVLDFSTHIHIGAQIVPIMEGNFTGKDGSLVADRDGLFSLLWINNGNDTVVYHYTYHLEYAKKAPAPGLAFGALAVAAAAFLRRR